MYRRWGGESDSAATCDLRTVTCNSDCTLVTNASFAHWPFQPTEPRCWHSQPQEVSDEVWPRSKTEGSTVAATKPALPPMNPHETASPALPAPFPSFLQLEIGSLGDGLFIFWLTPYDVHQVLRIRASVIISTGNQTLHILGNLCK